MSGQYSDERFFFAKYGCCIPTESYAWILVVLFVTTVLVLLFCMLATATIRWMYKRRMRKRLQDLKKKYLNDQLRAQEFDAKLNHLAITQKNKIAADQLAGTPKDAKSEKFTIFVDPAQNYAQHANSKKKGMLGQDGPPNGMKHGGGLIYDRDDTPIAQSSWASQSNAGPLPRPSTYPPRAAPLSQLHLEPAQQNPQLAGYQQKAPPLASTQQSSAPQGSTMSDPPLISSQPPVKKASLVNTLDHSLSEKTKKRDKKLEPPSTASTSTTGTVSSTTGVPVSSEPTAPLGSNGKKSATMGSPPKTAVKSKTTGNTSSGKSNVPIDTTAPPSTQNKSETTKTSESPTDMAPVQTKSQSTKSSPTDGETQSASPSLKEEQEKSKKHRVEYGMDDIVSPRVSEKEKEKEPPRKEGAGGKGEWKYYYAHGSDSKNRAPSTTSRSTMSNRQSTRSWLFDSTGSSRFDMARQGSSRSSSIIKTDSSQYKTASIEQYPHGAFSFQDE